MEPTREAATCLLELRDVSRSFGGVEVLTPIDLKIARGEFVSIVGPSGCGKSTLMNIVAGLVEPTSGRVMLEGRDITGRSGHVGYMFQKDLLIPWRTVLGNITFGAALKGRVSKGQLVEAAEMARHYGLSAFLDNYPHTLSGGMRQRVALMRTLALGRPIMLLDEPFGALDAQTRVQLQQWLLAVWAEMQGTILFITHDIEEAVFLSDRVLVMSRRPAAIAAEIRVDLERPRGVVVTTSEEFIAYKRQAMEILYSHRGLYEEVTDPAFATLGPAS